MTKKELIEAIEKFPDDAEIWLEGGSKYVGCVKIGCIGWEDDCGGSADVKILLFPV